MKGAQITANALSGTVVVWSPYLETGKNLDSLDDDVTKNSESSAPEKKGVEKVVDAKYL